MGVIRPNRSQCQDLFFSFKKCNGCDLSGERENYLGPHFFEFCSFINQTIVSLIFKRWIMIESDFLCI